MSANAATFEVRDAGSDSSPAWSPHASGGWVRDTQSAGFASEL